MMYKNKKYLIWIQLLNWGSHVRSEGLLCFIIRLCMQAWRIFFFSEMGKLLCMFVKHSTPMTASNLFFRGNSEVWHMQSGGCWTMMVLQRLRNPHCLFQRCNCPDNQHTTAPQWFIFILNSLCMRSHIWFLLPSGWYWFDRSPWITRFAGKGDIYF